MPDELAGARQLSQILDSRVFAERRDRDLDTLEALINLRRYKVSTQAVRS
jgi:hypothetical protein